MRSTDVVHTYGNRVRVKGKTNRQLIEEALAEAGVQHGGVRWKNIDPNNVHDSSRGWLVRLSGKWVRAGRSVSEALRYVESISASGKASAGQGSDSASAASV